MNIINLDHISGNLILPEVQEAMITAIRGNYGNPSSQHKLGDQAAQSLENARETAVRLSSDRFCPDPSRSCEHRQHAPDE